MPTEMISTVMPKRGDLSAATTTPRRQWATRDDWDKHQATIQQLFVEDNKKLPEVMMIMKERYHFNATKKMFKDRLSKWGFSKNLRESEARAMVRKRYQRSLVGRSSAFQIHGREVDVSRVKSYLKRKNLSIDEIIAQRASTVTPPYIECGSPVPSPLRASPDSERLEIVIKALRDYCRGMVDCNLWTERFDWVLSSVKASAKISASIKSFQSNLFTASDLYGAGDFRYAGRALLASQADIESIVRAEDPHIHAYLLNLFLGKFESSMPGIGFFVLKHFAAMARTIFSEQHPICQAYSRLLLIPPEQILNAVYNAYKSLADNFESILGPLHIITLNYRMSSIYTDKEIHGRSLISAALRCLLEQCKYTRGPHDPQSAQVLKRFARSLYNARDDQESIDCLERCIKELPLSNVSSRSHLMECLAHCYLADENYLAGKTCLQEATDLFMENFGRENAVAVKLLVQLEGALKKCGEAESAARVREEWIQIQDSLIEIV